MLTGAPFGEAAALKWRHDDPTQTPLGRLLITASSDVHKREEKRVKTELTREVPVHPVLARLLAEWKLRGWAETMGRAPTPDDLIVPSREGRNRNANTTVRRFHKDLQRLGLRKRRQQDMRRTFISLARTDGARADVLERVAHAPRGDIMNLYTTLPVQLRRAVGHDKRGGHHGDDDANVVTPAKRQAHGLVTTAPGSYWNVEPSRAGRTGLEPAASGVTGRRYNQLNYRPEAVSPRCLPQGPPRSTRKIREKTG